MTQRLETAIGSFHSWLWPDRAIGKRESRALRDEHNALINEALAIAAVNAETIVAQQRALRQAEADAAYYKSRLLYVLAQIEGERGWLDRRSDVDDYGRGNPAMRLLAILSDPRNPAA